MKLYFIFEGVSDCILTTAIEQALELKEQIRASTTIKQRTYLQNKLNSLYTSAIGLDFGTSKSNFKKLA